jgi:ribosomal protein L11 methyltransferase
MSCGSRCTRAEAEAPGNRRPVRPADQPVIVADEPDPNQPDDWRIHAYFRAATPGTGAARRCQDRDPDVEHLGHHRLRHSQSGLEPIRASFFVHTPMHYADRVGTINRN